MTLVTLLRTTAPTPAVVTILGNPVVDSTLTVDEGVWVPTDAGYGANPYGTDSYGISIFHGGSAPVFTYQWQLETGVGTGTYANIPGATNKWYVVVTADIGLRITCVVSALGASATATPVGPVTAATATGFLNVATGCPQVSVELDVTTDPTTPTRVWTDITQYVRGITLTTGGRNHELQRTDAGTATIIVSNRDGRFDPTNATGPYYGGLKRMRWLRIRGLWNGVVYPRCQMLVTSYDQDWPAAGRDAITTIQASDVFKALSLFDLAGATFPEQTSGERISAVLSTASVANGTIDTGQSTLAAITDPMASGSKALEHLRSVEETENGQIYADKNGVIVFDDRHHRLIDTTTVGTVGDNPGEIPYKTSRFTADDANIWNDINVTAQGGTAQTAQDTVSMAAYYQRTLSRQILSTSDAEALSCAEYLLHLYADPPPRLPQIELVGQANTAMWPTILTFKNSDRLLWRRRPSTEAAPRTIEQEVLVEQVSETIQVGKGWATSLDVSPADKLVFWQLDVAGRSELGVTTRLAY